MSYILDALRKSEQQRQAVQPDSVTDRILVNPTQTKQKPAKWLLALAIINLLAIVFLAWFFTQKTAIGPQPTGQMAGVPDKSLLPVKPKNQAAIPTLTTPDNKNQTPLNPMDGQTKPPPRSPSIAQLVEAQKMAAMQQTNPKAAPEKKADKKPLTVKKETTTRTVEAPPKQLDMPEAAEEKPAFVNTPKGTPDLNELSYEVRNNLPNLNINVFSYDHRPEDRFVIIDMVKYRAGQLIKGSVKLKEIRPDSIVLEYGDNTFKVERP
jgi:general secretion pathway protein B